MQYELGLEGALSPTDRIHGSGNQELEVAFLTIISNNLLGSQNGFSHYYLITELLLPVLGILSSADLEILGPNGRIFPLGITTVAPLNWKMRLSVGDIGVLMPLNQQAKTKPKQDKRKHNNKKLIYLLE